MILLWSFQINIHFSCIILLFILNVAWCARAEMNLCSHLIKIFVVKGTWPDISMYRTNSLFYLASFPGCSRLQFLITCSMQNWRLEGLGTRLYFTILLMWIRINHKMSEYKCMVNILCMTILGCMTVSGGPRKPILYLFCDLLVFSVALPFPLQHAWHHTVEI